MLTCPGKSGGEFVFAYFVYNEGPFNRKKICNLVQTLELEFGYHIV